eukprot:1365067-Prymnesium_polylepis.2
MHTAVRPMGRAFPMPRTDQSVRGPVGGGGHLPGQGGLQEVRRARLPRPHQARREWRPGPRLFVFCRGRGRARRDPLRRRADGDRRADRHGDAGARALRQLRGAPPVPHALHLGRHGRVPRRERGRRRLGRRAALDERRQGRRRLRDQRRQD